MEDVAECARRGPSYTFFGLRRKATVLYTNTLTEKVVIIPDGIEIKFKRDMCLCDHMPYIDMCESKNHVAILQCCRQFARTARGTPKMRW